MSDEPRPPAHSPGQRRTDGAPAWWSLLDRGDLPDDADAARDDALGVMRSPAPTPARSRPSRPRPRWSNWLVNLAALIVVLGVIMVGVGVDSARGALVVALLFGVPLVLVAITVTVTARRAR